MREYKDISLIDESVKALCRSPKNFVLMDASWHLHRYHHSFKDMTAGEGGRLTGHIYGFLSTIKMINEKIENSVIIICKDGKPVRRQKLLETKGENYKPGREELDFNIFADYPVIMAAASCLPNVYEAFLPDQESDDLMSNLARQITHLSPESFVYVYSGDDDLLQTIDDGHVCVLRKFDRGTPIRITNEYLKMDERMLEKYHGCDSYHLPYYRSICGDHSDCLPGIPRFNREVAKLVASVVDSVDQIFDKRYLSSKNVISNLLDKLIENESLVRFNYQLMALRDEFTIKLVKYTPPKEKAGRVLEKYRMNSFLSYLRMKG